MTAISPTLVTPASERTKSIWKPVGAALIGNTLEWFDLSVYAYFALTISKVFFPAADPAVSLFLAFATFGISFLIRPLGAAVLGSYADRQGRKKALSLSILLMLIGTAMIAVMPGYATIGIIAPIGILLARLLQGFSAGGEFGSSTAFMMEHAPQKTRNFVASLQFASQGFGVVIASLFGYFLTTMGVLIVSTASNFMIKYMPSYAATTLNIPQSSGFLATLTGGLILTLVTPVVGFITGFVSRIKIMLWASILYMLMIVPAFMWLNTVPSATSLLLVVSMMALIKAVYFAPLASLMADVFPVQTRVTGMSLSYNLSVTIFGGFAPVIATGLIALTGSQLAPSFYLILAAALSISALWVAKRRLKLR